MDAPSDEGDDDDDEESVAQAQQRLLQAMDAPSEAADGDDDDDDDDEGDDDDDEEEEPVTHAQEHLLQAMDAPSEAADDEGDDDDDEESVTHAQQHLLQAMDAPSEAADDDDDEGDDDDDEQSLVQAQERLLQIMDVPLEATDDEGDDDDDEESVAQAQERLLQALMARTDRALPRRALERDWDVLGELGSGSYGRVLLARPRHGGAQVALKLLSKERTPRWGFLREFCTHLCLRGALTCVQVLPLAFETPTEFGFAQELAPAGDLCGLLTPGVGLPEPQVKRCAAQVCSALSYLHGHALVHRDLKLDNVLAFDRECHLVKLGDFGLTRVQGWQVRPAPGPAPYAAPELLHLRAGEARQRRLEPAADTWAFGVLLFALLTGAFPWASPARSDPAFRRFRAWHGRTCAGEALPRPPRTWRGLGGAGLALLRGLLHPQPARRCPPGEVLRYLGGAWAGQRGQVRGAGEGGQVSSAGEGGQVSPTGESGQVSSAEEGSQVSSAGESWSSQVSPTGEGGQVSSADGSSQVSPTAEGESSQVSPTGDSESPSCEVGTPGRVRGTPGRGLETPGRVRGTPGRGLETAGQVRGTFGDGLGTPEVRWKHLEMG
ncbi:uncharacterized serine/threonine-protein kinase SBK3-like isoform X3 [Onychostruthus taczanowskii]|uniref:uncharacterized serine/threonine-protein kinase SBK3-like isoform X3 n=1 Tax=Onychostruthus taczanowskii TaxID=356909 RepID=UPI001B800B2C|nr:uncharacterized serine/threonine-protein kinase SBK3-like isoform X3 [Onychostruthus taczanowskii]